MLLTAALWAVFSCPALGQGSACGKRADVLAHLAHTYAEAPVALGVADNGGVIEVLATRAGATWTILLTLPSGVSCLIAAGENWETHAGPPLHRRPE